MKVPYAIVENGKIVDSTLPLKENDAAVLASIKDISLRLAKRIDSSWKNIEISTDKGYLLIYPWKEKIVVFLVDDLSKKPLLEAKLV